MEKPKKRSVLRAKCGFDEHFLEAHGDKERM